MIVRKPWKPQVPPELQALFDAEGLSLLGITDASSSREEDEAYQEWLRRGNHGTMDYMVRHREAKFNPQQILAGVQSIIFTGLNYYQRRSGGSGTSSGSAPPALGPPTSGPAESRAAPAGLVARYAWGRDYHKELGKRLTRLARRLASTYPGEAFRAFTDATPLSERHYAERSGLGFTGRHTLLINGEFGSWFFLGEILSTRAFPSSESAGTNHGACPSRCRRCIDVCPTGALTAPYRIDASRCISYLTIEHDGPISEELRPKIGQWLFGCDLCQEVCPLNVRAQVTDVPAFTKPIAGERILIDEILAMDNRDQFVRRFAGSPVMRAGLRKMKRNALIVAANMGARELLPRIDTAIGDSDPLIAEHARWARSILL